ncbi:MAG: histidine--tRNA ligase [Candidatus Dormibacteraeota bacterium]|nr:histidine--tRNA ligase [Candidatus Dormibacteraeota bacterium]
MPPNQTGAPPRTLPGMRDLLPDETATWARLERLARLASLQRGYARVETPILEPTELFTRGVGEATDIVAKEMFTFTDRGKRSVTLRPEATASVVRAYFQGGLNQGPQPARLWYQGPMFRSEKPQAGRYRQFFQYGIEAIGDASPWLDVEVIELAADWLKQCGVTGVSLQLNSIGDFKCRPAYREALRDHFRPHLAEMCEDDRRRFEQNPLRLLDCKKPTCTPFQAGVPSPIDYLCDECREHHAAVEGGLKALGIEYQANPRLVRGLDYYTRTAFEFWHADLEGAQNALGGGGRYDGLAETLGFAPAPAVGFAMGNDRVVLALRRAGATASPIPLAVYVIPTVADAAPTAATIARELRAEGWSVVLDAGDRSLKAKMRAAQKMAAGAVVIIGEDELKSGLVQLRDMAAAEQREVVPEALPKEVDRILDAAAKAEGGEA